MVKHKSPSVVQQELMDKRTFGETAADWVSDMSGSWKFIIGYLTLTMIWVAANILLPAGWDKYPFIFYTFSVSVLAILMSSIILLAGNRQAQVDRAHAENAYHQTAETDTVSKEVLEIQKQQVVILNNQDTVLEQLQHLLSDVHALMEATGVKRPTPE
jgi:uncharacterized membrane protein